MVLAEERLWSSVAVAADPGVGRGEAVCVAGQRIAPFEGGEQVKATEGACLHASLIEGDAAGPLHLSPTAVRIGERLGPRGERDLVIFAARAERGRGLAGLGGEGTR